MALNQAHTQLGTTLHFVFVLLQGSVSGELKGSSSWYNSSIVNGILDCAQSIVDGILDLVDGVFVGALEQQCHRQRVGTALNERVLVLSLYRSAIFI